MQTGVSDGSNDGIGDGDGLVDVHAVQIHALQNVAVQVLLTEHALHHIPPRPPGNALTPQHASRIHAQDLVVAVPGALGIEGCHAALLLHGVMMCD